MRKITTSAFVTCFIGVMLFCGAGWSQIVYQPTIRVPVTFYDFHADGSNPDFERPGGGLVINEVATTLDAQRKPVVGTSPYFSQRVAKWFRPWVAGDFTVPTYSAAGAYLTDATLTTDTAYKNVVFPDTLIFNLVTGTAGVYRLSSNSFFRLDGKGFGADDPIGQNPAHNFGFTMELHWQFTYQRDLTFNFEGDDDVWVFINGQRVIDLGGIHNPTAAQVNLNAPNNLGMIVGQRYMFDMFYAERHATGSDIIITTNIISANPVELLLNMQPDVDTIPAGQFIAYEALVKDDTGGFRHEFDPQIRWTLTPTGTTSRISNTAGAKDTFFAIQAYREYIIGASYTVSPTNTLRAFDTVYVKPGPDYRVWIEPDANFNIADTSQQMRTRLNNALHVTLVQMASTETVKTVVGVVRDTFGNYTHLAYNAVWSEVPITTSMINPVSGTAPNQYAGVINRTTNDSGRTNVKVSSKDSSGSRNLMTDQTPVSLLLGYITKIKFVNAITRADLPAVNINTDQEITIGVMGVLSTDPDTNHWIDITGMWSLTNNVFASVTPLPTTSEGQWRFSPTKPGGFLPWSNPSNLTVTTGSGSTQRSATMPVTVTVAPPSSVVFTIITPQDQIIAGVPIIGVVSIYNKDGLVPGRYCYPGAIYQDSLGKGTLPDPIVNADTSGIINGTPNTANTVRQCFNNGVDTASFTLYRAPYHNITDPDTMHQLVVLLDTLSATTGPFKLNPGPLTTLRIEDVNGVHLTGTDTLKWPSGAITVYSVGYDLYGNKRGREASNWYVTGTLHQPDQTIGVRQIYYDASKAIADESGMLYARALRSAALNDSTGDSLGFYIKGPPSALDSAVTRDINGNGYLDEIELYFSKPVTFPADYSLTNFSIIYPGAINVPFTVKSMDPIDASGTKYVLHLAENTTSKPGSPQTAWKPYISLTGSDNSVPPVPTIPSTQCRDGAGPVIWSVTKTIINVSDRTTDNVRVIFSEPIQGPNGSPFAPANVKPEFVLNVFRKNTSGGWDVINSLSPMVARNGIDTLRINSFRPVNDSTIEFSMTNGKDLTTNDYINIDTDVNQIYDGRSRSGGGVGVAPIKENQKVQVKVLNNTPRKIIPVPNPSGPIFTRPGQQPGNFSFVNNPSARDWVREDQKGTVLTFDLSPPKAAGDSIVALCKIYDLIGNIVTQADTVIRYNPLADTSTTIQYNAYWNGSNSRGMKVAPGLYSTAVYLTYNTPEMGKKLVKLWGVIGIQY